MRDEKIRSDAAEMNAVLEQISLHLELIEEAFLRLTDLSESGAEICAHPDFPLFVKTFREQQDALTAEMETGAELCKIYTECEAAVLDAIEMIRLPL